MFLLGVDHLAVATGDPSKFALRDSSRDVLSYSKISPVTFNKRLDLSRMQQVAINERDCWITISLKHKSTLKAVLSKQPLEIEKLKLASSEDSIQLFTALHEKLGPQFKYTRSEWSALRSVLFCGINPLIVGLMTWGMWWVERQPDLNRVDSQKSVGRLIMEPVLHALGPTGILLIGGIATSILLVWAIRKASNPPIMLKLKK